EDFLSDSAGSEHTGTPFSLSWLRILRIQLMNMPAAHAVITPAQTQPSVRMTGLFFRSPITLALLVRRITSTISGGASTPLRTAERNSIRTELNPAKSRLRPTTTAAARTA